MPWRRPVAGSPLARLSLALALVLAPALPLSAAPERAPAADAPTTAEEAGRLFETGRRYEMADGLPPDLQKAHTLYCKAARMGNADAAYRLGWLYWTGLGVRRDAIRAFEWMAVAAQDGHWEASRTMRLLPTATVRDKPDCQLATRRRSPRNPLVGDLETFRRMTGSGPVPEAVRAMAPQFGLDPQLVLAVIAVESGFRPDAVSPRRAQGLMQLIPATAARFGVRNAFDPVDNLLGGMRYLRWLLAYFEGDVRLALAGYNAGEGAVDRHGGIPPYAETQEYVRRVGRLFGQEHVSFDATAADPSAAIRRRSPGAR